MLDAKYIGPTVKFFRQLKFKKLSSLEKRSGIYMKSLANWENGVTIPELGSLLKLIQAFGINHSQFFDKMEELAEQDNKSKPRLIQIIRFSEPVTLESGDQLVITIPKLSGYDLDIIVEKPRVIKKANIEKLIERKGESDDRSGIKHKNVSGKNGAD